MIPIDPLVILLVAGLGLGVERYYTQRWTVAANAAIIWSTLGLGVLQMKPWLTVWAIGLIPAAVLSVMSYLKNCSLEGTFYNLTHALYSSKTVLGVLLSGALGFIQSIEITIVIIVIIWAAAIVLLQHKIPFR